MRSPLVVAAIAFVLPSMSACSILDAEDDEWRNGGAGGASSGSGSGAKSPSTKPPPPTEFQCAPSARAKLAVETAQPRAALTIEAGVPPIITTMTPVAPIWGDSVTIHGSGLGDGDGGEYVTFGSGENEQRLDACPASTSSTAFGQYAYEDGTCASFSPYSSDVSFIVPLGAAGDVAVHTKHGNATAGSVGATWRSSAVRHAPGRPRVHATLATATATYALVVDDVENEGPTAPSTPTLVRFTDTAVSSLKLSALGTVDRFAKAAFAERADGGVDLGVDVNEGGAARRLRFVHVMPNGVDVEIEEACVPSSRGPLVMRRGATGTAVWAYLDAIDGGHRAGLARLVHIADEHIWKIDRGPMTGPDMGVGIERDDGSVLIAWDADMGGFFDAKAQARFARLAPGDSSFREDQLHEVLDDYVGVNVLDTSAGFVVVHCSYDSTGLFDDKGIHGSHCHAVLIDGSGARGALPGYPETFDTSWRIGIAADRVVAIRQGTTVDYYASPTDAPSVIAGRKPLAWLVPTAPSASAQPTAMLQVHGAHAVATPR